MYVYGESYKRENAWAGKEEIREREYEEMRVSIITRVILSQSIVCCRPVNA